MEDEETSHFIKAPDLSDGLSVFAKADLWLADQGLATGLFGAALLALAAVCVLAVIVKLVALLRRGLFAKFSEGKVVEVENAEGGGFHPVIAYTDKHGRRRKMVAAMRTSQDPTGRRVIMRVDGPKARMVETRTSPLRDAALLVLPVLVASAATATALTGRLAGVAPLP